MVLIHTLLTITYCLRFNYCCFPFHSMVMPRSINIHTLGYPSSPQIPYGHQDDLSTSGATANFRYQVPIRCPFTDLPSRAEAYHYRMTYRRIHLSYTDRILPISARPSSKCYLTDVCTYRRCFGQTAIRTLEQQWSEPNTTTTSSIWTPSN